ncbi:hypothetical protein TIFTF001_019257 [Ficus carica]|uniref:Uncharacterized protein n=1 Tax=Ficus carica TaxID=3494 RepID=A0AA88AD29_FICCA|nr:hypothetical protein TIFTF001_019257 [Ficus carica]
MGGGGQGFVDVQGVKIGSPRSRDWVTDVVGGRSGVGGGGASLVSGVGGSPALVGIGLF